MTAWSGLQADKFKFKVGDKEINVHNDAGARQLIRSELKRKFPILQDDDLDQLLDVVKHNVTSQH